MHTRSLILLTAAFMFMCGTSLHAQQEVDKASLISTSAGTAKRIQQDGAVWSNRIDIRKGIIFIVERAMHGTRSLWRISAEANGRRQVLAQIIARDGTWYVTEQSHKQKYRPYEPLFQSPAMYLWMQLAQPRIVSKQDADRMSFTSTDDRILGRMPLPDSIIKQMTKAVEEGRSIMNSNPTPDLSFAANIREMEDMLKNGTRFEIDKLSGIVTLTSNPKMTTETNDFRFFTPTDENQFNIDTASYEDQTAPVASDMNDVVLIGHAPFWRPGQPTPDLDLVTLNVKTGEERRIPFAGAAPAQATFSLDRNLIWMTGGMGDDGILRLVQVDLKTGANRLVPTPLAQTGQNIFVQRSIDGGKLCFMHTGSDLGLLKSEIVVVDFNAKTEKVIGDPADYAPAQWAIDDTLVFLRRDTVKLDDSVAMKKIVSGTICTMTLSGKITEIGKAFQTAVLADGKTVLFQQDKIWKTCDLIGNNIQLLADGLPHASFPTNSPDGKQIMMMDYSDPSKGPQPIIITLANGNVMHVPVRPGLWAMPSWK